MLDNSLFDIGRKYGTDKVTHFYLHHYDALLKHLRNSKIKLLEIGELKKKDKFWRI